MVRRASKSLLASQKTHMSYDASDDHGNQRRFAAMYGEPKETEVECGTCGTVYIEETGHCEFHLRLVCSWCKKPQGYKPCTEDVDGLISHTICNPCGETFRKEMNK